MPYYVYMLASQTRGTLYIGMTNDVARRTWEHREGYRKGFTARHGVRRVVMVETYQDVRDAIGREKQLKRWKRAWKIALIEEGNPTWADLYDQLLF
jgi:putative endonuclease